MIQEARDRRVYQLPLPRIGATIETYIEGRRQYHKEVDIGSSGLDIVQAIVDQNEDISHIAVIPYDLTRNSDKFLPNDRDNIVWIDAQSELQQSIIDLNHKVVDSGEQMALAVCSCVMLRDGTIAHIPMMDCASENDIDKEVTRDWLTENGLRGYLLQTDKSFHFWGVDLISDTQFMKFMQNSREHIEPVDEYGDGILGWQIYCKGFVNASTEAGFAALRIFGYENENKKVAPFVVDVI